jgi:hypothetical protein
MKLKVKFWLLSATMLSIVLVLGVVSVGHLMSLRHAAAATAARYDAMDRASAASAQVGWLGDVLSGPDSTRYLNTAYLDPIRTDVLAIVEDLKQDAAQDDGDARAELDLSDSAAIHLDGAAKHLANATGTVSSARSAPLAARELSHLRQSLLAVANLVPAAARHHAMAASDELGSRIRWMCILLVVLLAISLALHGVQYRTLVRPLMWLRAEMRRSAARNYRQPVRPLATANSRKLRGSSTALPVNWRSCAWAWSRKSSIAARSWCAPSGWPASDSWPRAWHTQSPERHLRLRRDRR